MIDVLLPIVLITSVIKLVNRILSIRANKHFKNRNPDKLLRFIQRGADNGPDSNEITIFGLAQVYAYYGMYDSATEQINVIDWTKKPNRLKSFETRYQAIIQYIRYQNFNQGLDLANESLRLGKFNFGKESYKIIIQVGEVLNGDVDDKNSST